MSNIPPERPVPVFYIEEMNEVTPCQSRKGFKPNYRILYTEKESERGQWTSEASSHSRVVLVPFASANSGKFSALWGPWELHRAWLHWCTFPRNCSESTGTIQTNQLHRRLYLREPIGARVISNLLLRNGSFQSSDLFSSSFIPTTS